MIIEIPLLKLRRDAKASSDAGQYVSIEPLELIALLRAERQLLADPLMYPTERAAPLVGLSPETLDDWRGKGIGPKWVRLGRKIAYPREELLAWANNFRRFQSTTQADQFELAQGA